MWQKDTTAKSDDVVDDLWTAPRDDADADLLEISDMGIDLSLQVDEEDSSVTTKYILIGGTVMVLAAAAALAVTMGNELGIDLELG